MLYKNHFRISEESLEELVTPAFLMGSSCIDFEPIWNGANTVETTTFHMLRMRSGRYQTMSYRIDFPSYSIIRSSITFRLRKMIREKCLSQHSDYRNYSSIQKHTDTIGNSMSIQRLSVHFIGTSRLICSWRARQERTRTEKRKWAN